ncbi:isoleucyl-tRNA synthetase [Mycoplasma ovis str. Michigan]|uniref:Isoleucine--tRNA ligase n=1 Tax=Mycoplasma ovis str. Michigan TaxID=1415773 RepID=A0ABM5P0B4_9MOLU|nr:isoleucine--tRNA ligase [Mycoplasma ovis]AHC39862.1 isoleucyl-tRNA synthetase [Mycoplasma ovis str. Michigan]
MSIFRKTLRLPKTDFPMKANLVERQADYSQFWLREKVYESRLKKNSNKSLFLVIDGPPYANGAIHMGHALNKILKDFIVRWKNISGFKSPFLPGWDVHGLPIEHKVETETKDFKRLSLPERREKAFNYAKSQLNLQLSQLKSLHLIHPLNNYYSTSDIDFIEREYSLFLKLWEKGLIIREYKPVAWSYSSQTALAESEIEYEEVECESIYFSWEIVNSNNSQLLGSRIILWTTTPYSLESNLAIALNPELQYSLARDVFGKIYIASKNFFLREGNSFEIIREISAKDLLNSQYLNNVTGEKKPIFSADFVLESQGSGFVHLAPGLGPEDYLICKKNNISPYCLINHQGFFEEGVKFSEISGKFYKDASQIVIEFLKKTHSLLRTEKITHKVGKDWRTKKPILYRATEQWFLNLKDLKNQLNKSFAEKTFSNPDWLFAKLKETVFSREEWCISRQRAWGLPIPIIFKNGKEFGGLNQLKKNVSILLKEGVDAWYTKPISHFIGEQDNLEEFTKSYDVLDVWFDSGSVFSRDEELINHSESSIVYLEGIDQLRGWFNSSSILSIASNNCLPFSSIVSHGFVLDASKEKMSKSKGNVIDPVELIKKVGADIFRLWIASVNYSKDISFGEEKISISQQDYRRIRNIIFRFSLGIIGTNHWGEIELSDWNFQFPEHQYMYLYFWKLLISAEVELNSFNFYKVISKFKEFLELYSSWYLELVKSALYSRDLKDIYRNESVKVISTIFKYSLILFSIFIPQTAEEVYRFLDIPNKQLSIFLEDWNLPKKKNLMGEAEFEKWNYFFQLRSEILSQWEKQMDNKSSGEKLQLLKEQKVFLPKKKIKYFENEDLTRLLMVAEIEESQDEEISFELTKKPRCQRCLCSCESLIKEQFEEEEHNLCHFCCLSLQEYRENNERKS